MHVYEPLPVDLTPGIFLQRVKRFVALVSMDEKEEKVHLPSSGRMTELLVPGARVFLTPGRGTGRKTRYSLCLVHSGKVLVSIDSLLPNRLVKAALSTANRDPGYFFAPLGFTGAGNITIHPETTYRHSRFDFCLAGAGGKCFMEVKSVTLVEEGVAKFPDAPSRRGVKHLEELRLARREGFRAVAVFVVQREDARGFTPGAERDPAFAAALKEAFDAGVEIYAYTCKVSLERVELNRMIPVYI